MDETEYHLKADPALHELLDFAEGMELSHDIEVNLDSGVLSIIMPDEKEYIINKHAPSRQIWVSSPYSGAGYFEYKESKWMPKRAEAARGRDVVEFIIAEIRSQLDMSS